jgi:hypothetical protein
MINKPIMTGFNTGEANRNAITGPNGTPLLRRPVSTGTVEHEQKGVMAPRALPRIYCNHGSRPLKNPLIRAGGRYSIRRPTIKAIRMKMSTSSPAITRKNLAEVTMLLISNNPDFLLRDLNLKNYISIVRQTTKLYIIHKCSSRTPIQSDANGFTERQSTEKRESLYEDITAKS